MKYNKYLVWTVVLLPSIVLLMSVYFKFFPPPEAIAGFEKMGYAKHRIWLAWLELFITLAYIVPASRRIGFYLLASYMGGAIALHVGMGDIPLLQCGLLALLWVGAGLSLNKFLIGAESGTH
jgi:hypothetical protein